MTNGLPRALSLMVYGATKAGKSTLASTSPYPRLMLDVEGGARFLVAAGLIHPRTWDPYREAPPVADGTWDTVVVNLHDYDTMLKVYEWLRSGQHQFRSLIIDSISELQDKLLTQLAGNDQVKMQQWGEVLRKMGGLLRNIRDLTTHPTNPLEAVVLTAMAKQGQDGVYRPYLQGALQTQAPYLFDVVGAIAIESYPNPDPMQPPLKIRRLYVESTDKYEAGERVQGRLGTVVEQQDLNVETMLDRVFGPREIPQTQTT